MTLRRKLVYLVIAVIIAASVAIVAIVASGTGSGESGTGSLLAGKCKTADTDATRAPSSQFYAIASGAESNWQGLIGSNGRRYTIPNLLTGARGTFSPDRATVVVGYPAHYPAPTSKKWFVRIVNIGGSSRVVATGPQTAPPVLGPHGEIAYASGTTLHYLDGRTIRARGLPKGAEIIKLELSSKHLTSAALVTWGGGGAYPSPNEALYVVSPHGSRRVAGDFDALSEQPDPVWSPKGDEIAFERLVRAQDGINGVIFVVRSNGSGLRRISGERASGPVWSPDGKLLAYTQRYGYQPKKSNGVPEVYIANLLGNERRLTDTPALAGPINGVGNYVPPGSVAGAWSPDGCFVAVITNHSLGVVPANGGKEHVVTTAKTVDFTRSVWWPPASS